MVKHEPITVIGAGLAGSEAAWQIANRGVPVRLHEMRPVRNTPAHHTDRFAELVCSNSLRAAAVSNAVGLLKEEMRRLDSLIMRCADEHAVPAGGALAVDREAFSQSVTDNLTQHPLVEIVREEIEHIPSSGITVIATGPLTSPSLSESIRDFIGEEYLYFFDAAAPIVLRDSIDMEKTYFASRYNKGEAAYINCPMNEAEFTAFHEALIGADTVPVHDFEDERYFEGCMPIEVMAQRGAKTVLFGPMKPVGLEDPRSGKRPFAVVQLRQDNAAATMFNIVGFQTHLKWGEQARVFRMIPGLEQAEFARFGVMHRNTFINSPKVLTATYQSTQRDNLLFVGQMTGVEGYVESAAAGLVGGVNAARLALGVAPLVFPPSTAIGSLASYITRTESKYFQPMNATFGLLPPLDVKVRDKRRRGELVAERALDHLSSFVREEGV